MTRLLPMRLGFLAARSSRHHAHIDLWCCLSLAMDAQSCRPRHVASVNASAKQPHGEAESQKALPRVPAHALYFGMSACVILFALAALVLHGSSPTSLTDQSTNLPSQASAPAAAAESKGARPTSRATAELEDGEEEVLYAAGDEAAVVGTVRKQLYFVVHSQATSDEAAEEFPEDDSRRETEIFGNMKYFDPPLSQKSLGQCRQLRDSGKVASLRDVDLVLVSPLTRALQTAVEVFPTSGSRKKPRFVVLESLREFNSETPRPCDWRRMRKDLEADFPTVDFSVMSPSIDMVLGPGMVEAPDYCDARLMWLLVWLRQQPEAKVALVSHRAVLARFFKEFLRPAGYRSELSDDLQDLEVRTVPISFE
eukprot:TRINITY_DN103474_c0_g1_i1.p1 TRINITY_DN103474_c0_g1~~TRINITY_DN103474_c0_g1_i1.p1  ORF type:complete len:367 (+),score=46.47 TRINITY_DN103474_c0_g1_i1:85-1185(+)